MRSLRLISAASLALFALVACGDDKPTPPSAPDAGVAACRAALASYQSGEDSDVPAEVITGLKASGNADLKAVGAAFEQLNAISDEEAFEHLDEILAAMSKLGTGCAAVGVPLPSEMVQPQLD